MLSEKEIALRLAEYDQAKAKKQERILYLQELIQDDEIDLDEPVPTKHGWPVHSDWHEKSDEERLRLKRREIEKTGEPPVLIRGTEAWKVIEEEKREKFKKALEEERNLFSLSCQRDFSAYVEVVPRKKTAYDYYIEAVTKLRDLSIVTAFGTTLGLTLLEILF